MTLDLTITASVDELPRPIVELRLASILCRVKDSARIFMGSEEDFEQEVPRKIVAAAQKIVRDKVPGGPTPASIAEYSGVPENEIRELAYAVTPDMMAEYELYAARIQAEGYKSRKIRELEAAHATMARTPWRDVELAGAKITQEISRVQMVNHGRGRNDVGVALERVRKQEKSIRQIPFPWQWWNDLTEGGIRPSQKHYLIGPPGSRKSTIKYNAELFWALNGEHVVDFLFDGGTVEAQSTKLLAIRWRQLAEQHKAPLAVMVDTGHGYSDYPFINKTTVWNVLGDNDLGFVVPPDALELFWAAYQELQDMSAGGKGPGRITFIEPSEVLSNFYLMRQRLQSEHYDGMTIWCFDNHTKGTGKSSGEIERVIELVRVLHTFTDESHVPAFILGHMNQDSIKEIDKKETGLLMYGGPIEQDIDFEFLSQYKRETPSVLKVSLPKNREEASGQSVHTFLHVEPKSGYISDVKG